jgi:hypothetical protein
MGVPIRPDKRRNPGGSLDVAGVKDVQIVAWPQDGIARYPLHIGALGADALHGFVLEVPKSLWRTHCIRAQSSQHDVGIAGAL